MSDALPQSRLVDYRTAARRYDGGRFLPDDVLDRWWQAIEPRLSTPRPKVVDLGAGTGIFSVAWAAWGAAEVLAVEPSPEMRAEAQAKAEAGPGGFQVLAGAADAVPVPDGWADVVWLSTVLHHVPDRAAAGREVARVLPPGGRLLVRGFVPGRSRIPWFDLFPGADRAHLRFHTEDRVRATFEPAGLAFVDGVEVVERAGVRAPEAIAWVERMRSADSVLTALTDEEVAAGLQALRALGDAELERSTLTLLTFERPPA
jgi:SAM-dependent methyltransferase